MPIYEYECSSCGHIEEVWQKFSDPPVSSCTLCSGEMKKLISQSTFHLKGSGWYVTDYASKPSKEKGKGERPQKKDDGKKAKDATEKPKKSDSSES